MSKETKNSNTEEKNSIHVNNDRKVILLMGMGLNGVSAGGWLPPADTNEQAKEIYDDLWNLLESIDTFILGRVSFQMWEEYWPTQVSSTSTSDFPRRFSKFVEQIQKIMVSKTIKTVKWRNSKVINDNLISEIARIKKEPGKNIAVVGGPGIAQTFTKLNLFDEYQLYLFQMILGPEKSVLGVLDKERKLELIEAKIFQSGGLRLHYRSKTAGIQDQ